MALSFCRCSNTVIQVNICSEFEQLFKFRSRYFDIDTDIPVTEFIFDVLFKQRDFIGGLVVGLALIQR